jgi:hypothetical protein
MTNYILAYHGGKRPETPAEGTELMARWRAWMEGLGKSIVSPGNPVGQSTTVSASGITEDGGANPLSGYTIVQAGSLGAAQKMAAACPHLDHGTIEVAELMEM